MLLWLPASGLFGTQKVTMKKIISDEKTKQEKIKDEFRAEENFQNLFSSPPDNF